MEVPYKFYLWPSKGIQQNGTQPQGEAWQCSQMQGHALHRHPKPLWKLLWTLLDICIIFSLSTNRKWASKNEKSGIGAHSKWFLGMSRCGIGKDWILILCQNCALTGTWPLFPHHSPPPTQYPPLTFGEGRFKLRGKLKHSSANTASST